MSVANNTPRIRGTMANWAKGEHIGSPLQCGVGFSNKFERNEK